MMYGPLFTPFKIKNLYDCIYLPSCRFGQFCRLQCSLTKIETIKDNILYNIKKIILKRVFHSIFIPLYHIQILVTVHLFKKKKVLVYRHAIKIVISIFIYVQ